MIKVISLDIGGTLLKGNYDKDHSIKELAKLVNKDLDLVRKSFKDVFQKQKGSLEELVNKFCANLNITSNNDIVEFIKNKYRDSKEKVSSHDIEVIKDFKKRGYKVILFSNTSNLQKTNIDCLKDVVDDIFYSYEMGYTKSDEESYRIIEKKLNCKSAEFIHIGDNLNSDYVKPRLYGWHSLLFTTKKEEDIETIEDLEEINKYLD